MSFVVAEANLKTHYFQGDMMLTGHQQKVLNNAFKYASKRNDIENRAMIKDIARLWSDGKIPFAYAADIGKKQIEVAYSASMLHSHGAVGQAIALGIVLSINNLC